MNTSWRELQTKGCLCVDLLSFSCRHKMSKLIKLQEEVVHGFSDDDGSWWWGHDFWLILVQCIMEQASSTNGNQKAKWDRKSGRVLLFPSGPCCKWPNFLHNAPLPKCFKPLKRLQGAKCLTHWIQNASVQIYCFILLLLFSFSNKAVQASLELTM